MGLIQLEASISGGWQVVQAIRQVPWDHENIVTFEPVSEADDGIFRRKLELAVAGKPAVWVIFASGDAVLYAGAMGQFRVTASPSQ
ncbi:hypothetical protein [Kitasatospora sp. NPDC056181]|uniref:hypothetical protein n=1 Tax=Kitasatospora sp. NPDC056181 TaxID=3345737 RepID=UPI0035D70D5A